VRGLVGLCAVFGCSCCCWWGVLKGGGCAIREPSCSQGRFSARPSQNTARFVQTHPADARP
jgi:hypothetical protein